jgi:TatA/E family protein of Tat protein translocase
MEIILLLVLAVLLFGADKLPEMARKAGAGMKEFKDAVGGMGDVRSTLDTVNEIRSLSPTSYVTGQILGTPEKAAAESALPGPVTPGGATAVQPAPSPPVPPPAAPDPVAEAAPAAPAEPSDPA